jgi:hypothetical protein
MSAIKGWRVISPVTSPNLGNPDSFKWTRTGGAAISYTYSNGPFADLFAIGADLSTDYDSIDIVKNGEGNTYKLVAAQNGDEVNETHEVNGSHVTQNRIDNLKLMQMVGALISTAFYGSQSAEDKAAALIIRPVLAEIIRYANKVKADQSSYSTALDDLFVRLLDLTGHDLAAEPLIEQIMQDLITRGDQFLQASYTYRHTYVYADRIYNRAAHPEIFQKVNYVYTEAKMRTAESIPNDFYIPQSILPNSGGVAKPAYWLKMAPTASLTFGQKRVVSIIYQFADEWLDYLYNYA